ncbi:hypothetical protein EDD85DRAFT_508743 [Armillaria nabsnona]|nr:hypothetical protein EDD85DRAFT_508743 [Armillaria nabsnona]
MITVSLLQVLGPSFLSVCQCDDYFSCYFPKCDPESSHLAYPRRTFRLPLIQAHLTPCTSVPETLELFFTRFLHRRTSPGVFAANTTVAQSSVQSSQGLATALAPTWSLVASQR